MGRQPAFRILVSWLGVASLLIPCDDSSPHHILQHWLELSDRFCHQSMIQCLVPKICIRNDWSGILCWLETKVIDEIALLQSLLNRVFRLSSGDIAFTVLLIEFLEPLCSPLCLQREVDSCMCCGYMLHVSAADFPDEHRQREMWAIYSFSVWLQHPQRYRSTW